MILNKDIYNREKDDNRRRREGVKMKEWELKK